MRTGALTAVILMVSALGLRAEQVNQKFALEGVTLTYDTESLSQNSEIEGEDVEVFGTLLRQHPEIERIVLNSSGGSVWAAMEIARLMLDFDLETEVDGECSSACVNIFLAGERRGMAAGSSMGFHLRTWSPPAVERYYEDWKGEEGWNSPFEFASWIYEDTQAEVFDDLVYLVSRGVDADFAIRIKTPRARTWYPSRQELMQAGILTK
ncbi:MAG: hypothetical protein NXH84_17295 [Rhodobacteraceae bacterium]|jgi:hypothetical protein|nr:hypothetical protein [Paracoccaceae bacterium]